MNWLLRKFLQKKTKNVSVRNEVLINGHKFESHYDYEIKELASVFGVRLDG